MKTLEEKVAHRRSLLRLTMLEEEPVYLRVNLGGEINLPVTELGGGGARLLCYQCRRDFDTWYSGHSLGPSVLMLPETGMHEVQPVIRWKKWPVVGVQFMDLADKDRADIFRFLLKLERIKRKRMNGEPERLSGNTISILTCLPSCAFLSYLRATCSDRSIPTLSLYGLEQSTTRVPILVDNCRLVQSCRTKTAGGMHP
jgi:hypothetical protein